MRGKQGTDAGLCVKLAGQNRLTRVTSTRHSVTGPLAPDMPNTQSHRYTWDSDSDAGIYLKFIWISSFCQFYYPFIFQSSVSFQFHPPFSLVGSHSTDTLLIPFEEGRSEEYLRNIMTQHFVCEW